MARRSREKAPRAKVTDLSVTELVAIVDRAKQAPLNPEDHAKLHVAMETLVFFTQELQRKSTSLKRLRRWLFGASTEKTDQVLGATPEATRTESDPGVALADGGTAPADGATSPSDGSSEPKGAKPKRPGHGRNPAAAYTGAERVKVSHPSLHTGDHCPGCEKGRIYPLKDPTELVRITGMAPLSAKVYECDRARCNLCGQVFTAPPPEEVGTEKHDETAPAMIGLLKYGAGMPFNRIEKLQGGMGIPMPAATQWDLVESAAEKLAPAHEELIRQGAQGKVLHNDDTTMKVLEVTKEERLEALGDENRTGVFTSGIVSIGVYSIALFFTGVKHAGENLADVLAQRAKELPRPIQMCDALSRNVKDAFDRILANCIAHCRRNFVDVIDAFPEECRIVLEAFKEVYGFEATTRQQKLTDIERLQYHQTHSEPVMQKLHAWAQRQLDEKRVEPNSGLGDALNYLIDHWAKLTQFLKFAGAPLDNNICERVLKKAILHRKNAYFYKTLAGAHVGDIFMSLIHTCELNRVDPFDYLVELQRHEAQVKEKPSEWMPWNYRETLARLASIPAVS
jgi:transposase